MMFFDTPAEWHAALNDLPAALLFASVMFDWAGTATKKESLNQAAFWCLMVGVGGAALAVLSGLAAEGWVEHGGNTHRFIERHETLAIVTTIFFGALAGWRIFRKGSFAGKERPLYLTAATVGLFGLMWVAHIGGTIVFRQGVGVPSSVMREALTDRTREHVHAPGEEHDEPQEAASPQAEGMDVPDSGEDDGHTHAPGEEH